MGATLHKVDQFELDRCLPAVIKRLGRANFERERAAGQETSLDEIMTFVEEISKARAASPGG